MELESVTLKLPRELLSGAQRVATARDVTIGHMVRVLLKREVERQLSGVTPGRDPRLLAALQALLSPDLAAAADWADLAERLRPHGYDLRAGAGDPALFKTSCGTRVCPLSDLGIEYGDLVRRFGAPMPGWPTAAARRGVMPAGRIDARRHARLSEHIRAAANWSDLVDRLAHEGMELRAIGAELGIYVKATGRHLCNTGTVGARYSELVQRFGADLPDHPQDGDRHLPSETDPHGDLDPSGQG